MSNHTGLSPHVPNKYLGPSVYVALEVTRNREPTGADYRQPETGKLYPFGSFWIVGKNPTTGLQGDLWYLSKIVANVAYWIQISAGGAGTVIGVEVQAGPGPNPVLPNLGIIDFNGAVVANNSIPVQTTTPSANIMNLEVQYATTSASTDGTKTGLSVYDVTDFNVDATGFVSLIDSSGIQATNLGISYNAGTFTVKGFDGSSLSATKPAKVWLQDNTTPGQLKEYTITSNQTFTDGAGGTTATQRWNLTAGIDWATDMPFYLYAVGNDAQDTISFMISRIPHASVAPAATSIGQSGAIVNVGQGDFFSLRSITTTDYNGNACLLLGSFRMQFTGATNSWIVSALTTSDGIGKYQEGKTFNVARGQLGAAAGKFFANNGGTAPDMSVGVSVYSIDRFGFVQISIVGSIDTGGVGAVNATLISPLQRTTGVSHASGFWVGSGGSPGSTIVTTFVTGNTYTLVYNVFDITGFIKTANLLNTDFAVTAVLRLDGRFTASLT